MNIIYKVKKIKRKRKHGFRKRMKTAFGRRVLSKRRRKQREKLAV